MLSLVCGTGFGVLISAALLRPDWTFWPPPGKSSWQFRMAWLFTIVGGSSFVLLCILDRGTGIFDAPFLRLFGCLATLAGGLLSILGMQSAGLLNCLGLEGSLILSGPYRWVRNPQYVGYAVATIGLVLAGNARTAWLPALLYVILFLATPFLEERWLIQRFGDAYRRYAERVPRFGIRVR